MINDIIERADGAEKIAFMELRFAQPHPGQVHIGIEFLALQPCFIFGVVRLFRVTFRFDFDGMQFDTFTAFLDGFVHLRLGGLGGRMIGHRVEIQHLAVIIGIGITDGLETFFVSNIAVMQNIILDLKQTNV
jgi:hypothetical protein